MFKRYPGLELQLHLAHFEPVSLPCYDLDTNPDLQRFKAQLPLDQLDIIYVHGVADGLPFLALENWLESVSGHQLILLEDDLYALHRLRSVPWAQRLLVHPQVHLRFLQPPIDPILEGCARDFPSEQVAVTTLGKKKTSFSSIKVSLLRKTVLWSAVTSEILSGHLLHRNILSNLQRLPNSFYVNATKGAFAGQPALICGAGPSLSGVAAQLQSIRNQVLLIGCGSALSALAHLAVRPHLGIAIDPNAQEKECLKGCLYKDLPLIYGNRLYPEVFELFDGPYGYLKSPAGSALEKAIEADIGLNEPDIGLELGREALSVTTLALSLACFWGCSPIIFAGIDLAYEEGSRYAKGVSIDGNLARDATRASDQVVYRKGADGKRVSTLIKWVMEQQTIDAYTKLYPEISFINATGKGLGFSSIPHVKWDQIRKLVSQATSIDLELERLISQNRTPVSLKQIQNSCVHFHSSFLRCLHLAKALQQEPEGSGKAVLYTEELLHESAYQLTLHSAIVALERVYKLQIELSLNKNRWIFLQEIIEYYLQLLEMV